MAIFGQGATVAFGTSDAFASVAIVEIGEHSQSVEVIDVTPLATPSGQRSKLASRRWDHEPIEITFYFDTTGGAAAAGNFTNLQTLIDTAAETLTIGYPTANTNESGDAQVVSFTRGGFVADEATTCTVGFQYVGAIDYDDNAT